VLNPQWLGVMTGLFRYWSQGGTLAPFAAVPGKLLLAGDAGQAKAYRELLHDWFGDGVVKRDVPIGDGHLVDVLGDFPWRVLDEGGGIAPLAGEPVVAGLTAVRSRTVALDYLTGLQQGCHERDRLRAERDALVKARRTPPPMHRRAMRKLKRLARPVVRLVRSARDSRRPS